MTEQKKQLTQAVFDGLPVEYRWAAVDAGGLAFAAVGEMYRSGSGNFIYWRKDEGDTADFVDIGHGFDTTDWQNSKIERDVKPEQTAEQAEVEWLKLDADWLVERVLYWAEVVRRNPDISRDNLLKAVADIEKRALIVHKLIKEQDDEN